MKTFLIIVGTLAVIDLVVLNLVVAYLLEWKDSVDRGLETLWHQYNYIVKSVDAVVHRLACKVTELLRKLG